jgi:hypothetical protein
MQDATDTGGGQGTEPETKTETETETTVNLMPPPSGKGQVGADAETCASTKHPVVVIQPPGRHAATHTHLMSGSKPTGLKDPCGIDFGDI